MIEPMKPFLILIAALPALALAAPPVDLSLREAEKLWQTHSRELRQADVAVAAAGADIKVADQIPNPALSYNAASISRNQGVGGGHLSDKRMDSILRMDQLIERGGKRALRVQSAEARREAAAFDRLDVARTQLADLRRAYYDLLLAQDRQQLTSEASVLYARSLSAAEKRLQAGDLAPVDVSRLAVDKARADNDARQAQSDLEQSREVLAYLIGR